MTRILAIAALTFLAACATTPEDGSDTGEAPSAAVTAQDATAPEPDPENTDSATQESVASASDPSEEDSRETETAEAVATAPAGPAPGDFTPLLEASHFFASTASRYRQAATLAKDPEYITLLTSLAEDRQMLANETSQAVIYYEADDLAEAAGKPTAAYIGTAAQAGGEALGEALIESETALIDRLRAYLADDAVSVDAKTYFQAILPILRADRERVADLSGIELETADPADDDTPGAEEPDDEAPTDGAAGALLSAADKII